MKKKVVISSSSLPMRSPVGSILLLWLFLEHIAAPGWAYGVLWTIAGILVLGKIVDFCITTERDVPGFGEK
jgi:hypothetical protein